MRRQIEKSREPLRRPERFKSPNRPRDVNYLKVVAKTFWLLEAVAADGGGSHVSDLSRSLKMPKATVFRILYTMSRLGYIRQDSQTGIYRLTDKIARLSSGDSRMEALRSLARPAMEQLLARFEQTVNLGVLQIGQIFIADILEGLRSIRMSATVGIYQPVHCTALGKSIAAFLNGRELEEVLGRNPLRAFTDETITSLPAFERHLSRVRDNGYAVDDEETDRGARCIGAPIFGEDGIPFAAISVSGPISHIQGDRIREIGETLKALTEEISAKLGYAGSGSNRF
jgi:IclR family KDG regulon transcriptional repressor